jgi:hypothetical protein
MDTVEFFNEFLRKIGAPNILAIGITVIVLYLLISGIRKGIKGGGKDNSPDQEDKD